MSKRITENDLFLPALYVISQHKKANTSQIKKVLIEVFNPTGEDNEILSGRSDTKFSQKVRNLMGSHYETNGMTINTRKDKKGYFTLTPQGEKAVEENREYLSYLFIMVDLSTRNQRNLHQKYMPCRARSMNCMFTMKTI